MKKLFKVVAVAVLSLGFGVAANAQTSGDASIDVSAQVLGNLEVEAGLSLSFGQVMPGFKKYVSLAGVASSNSAGTANQSGVSQGTFNVYAAPGASVILEFELPQDLMVGSDVNKKMPIAFNQNLSGSFNTVAWGIVNDSNESVLTPINNLIAPHAIPAFPSNGITQEDSSEKNGITVYIGGTVTPASGQPSGAYTGTITLTASYN